MNLTETQKSAICDKLNRQIEAEHITPGEAARNLGIMATYVSMMRNPAQWHRCAKSGWEAAFQWYNSGQKLSEYSTAHGRTMMTPGEAVRKHDEYLYAEARKKASEDLEPEVKKVLVQETKEALKKEAEYIKQQMKKEFENQTLAEGLGRAKEELIREAANISTTAPLAVESVLPEPGQQFTDTARLKVALDIEINLVVNGQKVQVR